MVMNNFKTAMPIRVDGKPNYESKIPGYVNKTKRSTLNAVEKWNDKQYKKLVRMSFDKRDYIERAADLIETSFNNFLVESALLRAKSLLNESDEDE